MRPGTCATFVMSVVLCLFAHAQTTGVGDNRLSVAEKDAGFRLLFNAKDLDAWEIRGKGWEVREGMIVGKHPGGSSSYLVYRKSTYADFCLRASYLVREGSSGIMFRCKADNPRASGLSARNGALVGYHAGIGDHDRAGMRTGVLVKQDVPFATLADGWPTKAAKIVEPGDWNECEIICQGDRLVLRVNGVTCADVRDKSYARGAIALQLGLGGAREPTEVYVKNVRVAPLKPGATIPDAVPGVPAGWTQLYNGKDLDNWVIMGDKAGWQVAEGGVLRSEGAKGGNWLRSKEEHGDFVLHVEWKVSPGGNSGVFIRATEQGAPWGTGHEIQISNEQPPRDELHCTGTLYGTVPARPRPDESPNVWHTYDIHCLGPLITVIVDGKQTLNVDARTVDAIKDKPLVGYVGVQDSHTGPGGLIEYRNIRIKELEPGLQGA